MYEYLRELCPMWDTLSRADIEAARQQLQSRREEMFRRHAEELGAVERDQVEIEKLDQLISAFSKKFAPAASGKNELNAQMTGKPPGVSLLIT